MAWAQTTSCITTTNWNLVWIGKQVLNARHKWSLIYIMQRTACVGLVQFYSCGETMYLPLFYLITCKYANKGFLETLWRNSWVLVKKNEYNVDVAPLFFLLCTTLSATRKQSLKKNAGNPIPKRQSVQFSAWSSAHPASNSCFMLNCRIQFIRLKF